MEVDRSSSVSVGYDLPIGEGAVQPKSVLHRQPASGHAIDSSASRFKGASDSHSNGNH